MIKLVSSSVIASALLALGLAASPAHAQTATRAWVSGHGTDAAGCGAPTNACRSFQYVHDNIIAAGGEIDVLDPAGYGAVTITKAISIVNDGAGTAGVQAASGNAITVNASDVVTLRGLNIDGLGTASNGVMFNSGAGLTIVDCVIRHFGGNGVYLSISQATTKLLISNTIASDNTAGVEINTSGSSALIEGTLDHVTLDNNGSGIHIFNDPGATQLAISNSVITGSPYGGVYVYGSKQTIVSIDSSQISNNLDPGVEADNSAVILLKNNMIMSNKYGVYAASPNVASYSDNAINDNSTADIQGTITSFGLR
ncbi:right-handed parallel beta-helix repeat-containing protein [Methylocapsa sp. S129]|uniref:right-handed parallel beta-helix repeat-containing protein n=1 Tax=Methylocapsa sp. S129 TaxID=1641869 RepID=UPI00131ACF57|nr:right-handed parallel beta-helix repeat-containing protein [Methylocapsa sp. S129]